MGSAISKARIPDRCLDRGHVQYPIFKDIPGQGRRRKAANSRSTDIHPWINSKNATILV